MLSVLSLRSLGKQLGDQCRDATTTWGSRRIRCDSGLFGGFAPSLQASSVAIVDALRMPKVAARSPRPASRCFPSASPAMARRPGKQKAAPKDRSNPLISLSKFGAGEGIRTLDPNLGKVVLYP